MLKKFRQLVSLCALLTLAACGAEDDQTVSTPPSQPTGIALQSSFAAWLQAYPLDNASTVNPIYTWMERIHLHEALETAGGQLNSQPIVAILDSGVDIEHPALEGRIVSTAGYSTHCADDHHGCNTAGYTYGAKEWGSGRVYPVSTTRAGESCTDEFPSLAGPCRHGTHVSGIVAGFLPDSDVYGVCPTCRILPVRIVNEAGDITDEAIYAALNYLDELLQQGLPIRIINASFGKYQRSDKVMTSLANLMKRYDLLMVAASGNENSWQESFPAAFPNVISVTNVNSGNLQKDGRSNYGSSVDIAAPVGSCNSFDSGFGIISSIPGGSGPSQCLNGTSMAAPVVSGVAGLLWTVEPTLSAAQVKARILRSADRASLYEANPSFTFNENGRSYDLLGSGLLRADLALTLKDAPAGESKRVDAGCGVIAGQGNANLSLWLFLLPLLLPFFSGRAKADPQWDASVSQELGVLNNNEVKEGDNGLAIMPVNTGYGFFVGRLGLSVPLETESWSLRTRLDFISRSESYDSSWNSFFDNSDYEHFPLALHNSERTLRANQTVAFKLSEQWALRLEGEYQDISSGSRIGNSDDKLDTTPSAKGTGHFLRPAVDFKISPDDQVQLYALRLKSLDDEMGLDSFKTDNAPGKNLGVIYAHRFQETGARMQAHVFQNEFIFNDPFKDFTRRGMTVFGDQKFWQGKVDWNLRISIWQDEYKLPLVGLGSCSTIPENSTDLDLVRCDHKDQRLVFGTDVSYSLSEMTQVGFGYEYERNQNGESSLADFDNQTVMVQLTFHKPEFFTIGRENLRTHSRLRDTFSR